MKIMNAITCPSMTLYSMSFEHDGCDLHCQFFLRCFCFFFFLDLDLKSFPNFLLKVSCFLVVQSSSVGCDSLLWPRPAHLLHMTFVSRMSLIPSWSFAVCPRPPHSPHLLLMCLGSCQMISLGPFFGFGFNVANFTDPQ